MRAHVLHYFTCQTGWMGAGIFEAVTSAPRSDSLDGMETHPGKQLFLQNPIIGFFDTIGSLLLSISFLHYGERMFRQIRRTLGSIRIFRAFFLNWFQDRYGIPASVIQQGWGKITFDQTLLTFHFSSSCHKQMTLSNPNFGMWYLDSRRRNMNNSWKNSSEQEPTCPCGNWHQVCHCD